MNKTVTMFQSALIAFAFSMITALTMYAITRNANNSDKTKEQISLKADKTYVDKQDDDIKRQVNEVKIDLSQSVEVIRTDVREIRNILLNQKK